MFIASQLLLKYVNETKIDSRVSVIQTHAMTNQPDKSPDIEGPCVDSCVIVGAGGWTFIQEIGHLADLAMDA